MAGTLPSGRVRDRSLRDMLARLTAAAEQRGLKVTIVNGADEPPDGPFDVVTERHLLWLLHDPRRAMTAWRHVAPHGRLALFEALWGVADLAQARRQRVRDTVRRLRGEPPAHHAVQRLTDVEWARLLALPPAERLLGTTPQYVVVAGTGEPR